MKAYKAFKKDLTCRGFQFKEGEIFEVEGSPVLCENGFHFCKDLVLTLEYYQVNENIKENSYAEVEILGDVVFEEPTKHKGCTNKIKITRVLSEEEVLEVVDGKMNSGNNNSGYENSGDRNSGNRNSGNRNSGNNNSGYENSGNNNSGYENSGNWNSGNWNSGYENSGNRNSGDRNSGNRNSGNWNSGNRNSGYRNSGDRNSGNRNSGNWNSGDGNSGNRNSGNWNSCDRETGYFNSVSPKIVNVFNKPCKLEEWEAAIKPDFLYFEVDPDLGYKGSFQKSYNSASEEDKELLKLLPNFDPEVFFEISGIRV